MIKNNHFSVKTTETSIWAKEACISFGMGGKGLALFIVTIASSSRILEPEERMILIPWPVPFDNTTELK